MNSNEFNLFLTFTQLYPPNICTHTTSHSLLKAQGYIIRKSKLCIIVMEKNKMNILMTRPYI
jgi:hypothetical protein